MTPAEMAIVQAAEDARKGTPDELTKELRRQLSRERSWAACDAYTWDGDAASGELLYLGEPKHFQSANEQRATAYIRSMAKVA